MATVDPWVTDPRWHDRTKVASDNEPMYLRLWRARGDELAERRLALRVHGRETLHNFIFLSHNRAKRYP